MTLHFFSLTVISFEALDIDEVELDTRYTFTHLHVSMILKTSLLVSTSSPSKP